MGVREANSNDVRARQNSFIHRLNRMTTQNPSSQKLRFGCKQPAHVQSVAGQGEHLEGSGFAPFSPPTPVPMRRWPVGQHGVRPESKA